MSTIETIRTGVTDLTRDPNYRVWSTATVDRAINIAYTRMQQDLIGMFASNTTQSISIVAGTQEYALNSNFMILKNVNIWEQTLTKINKKDAIQNPDAVWTPLYYYIDNTNIGLYPTPTESWTLTVFYSKSFDVVSESTDIMSPVFIDTALIYLTASILFKQVWKFDFGNIREKEYNTAVDYGRLQLSQDENTHYWHQSDSLYNNISLQPTFYY